MTKWLYNNRIFNEELAERYFGFVYKITHKESSREYIGKKQFHSNTKMTPKELRECEDKRRKRVRKQSNWKTYNSSCKELQGDISAYGEDAFEFEILCLCENSVNCSYWEEYYQFKHNVLLKDSYNKNISGKYFAGRIKHL